MFPYDYNSGRVVRIHFSTAERISEASLNISPASFSDTVPDRSYLLTLRFFRNASNVSICFLPAAMVNSNDWMTR